MTEERLKVLEILQAGKINAEDASRLLEALNGMRKDDGDAVKVKVKVEKHHNGDGGDIEAQIEEEIEAKIEKDIEAEIEEEIEGEIEEMEAKIEEDVAKMEAKIEEDIEAEIGDGVKMKIKVKTHHDEDA